MLRRWLSAPISVLLLVAVVFLLSSLPILISPHENGVTLEWSGCANAIIEYMTGLVTGHSFLYMYGKNEHHFLREAGPYMASSIGFVAAAMLSGLVLSLFTGLVIVRWKLRRLQDAIALLSVLPDFVVMLLLQLLAVLLNRRFGVHVSIASFGDQKAVLLPYLSVTFVPFIYVLRQVTVQMEQTVTEDFIMLAKAKGLSKTAIYMYHVVPNLLPSLRAELPKLIGVIFGNLFIVEYLFNLEGITRLLFQKGAPFNLTANCLFALFLMYLIVYAFGRICLLGLERITSR